MGLHGRSDEFLDLWCEGPEIVDEVAHGYTVGREFPDRDAEAGTSGGGLHDMNARSVRHPGFLRQFLGHQTLADELQDGARKGDEIALGFEGDLALDELAALFVENLVGAVDHDLRYTLFLV